MKILFGLAAMAVLCAWFHAGPLWADTKTFTVSASVPLATSVNFTATNINAATGNRTAVSGNSLSFDPMSFNSTSQAWFPDHFFAVDVAPSGPGNMNVTVNYTEGNNPNNPAHGLGWKSTATFMKVTGTTETALTAHGPKKMLKDLSGESITTAEISGGFLRTYLGVVTKDQSAAFPDPPTSELFTNADKSGAYDGSLVITATVS